MDKLTQAQIQTLAEIKGKIIRIDSCRSCPEYLSNQNNNFGKSNQKCTLFLDEDKTGYDMRSVDPDSIPEWCELEDFPTAITSILTQMKEK